MKGSVSGNEGEFPRPEARKLQALGIAIRARRKAKSLSLEDVSHRSGKSVATLSRIEAGRQAIDVGMLMVLAEVIGFSAGALLLEIQAAHSPSKAERLMWNHLKKVLA